MSRILSEARALQRAYARTFGYFWLPCPVCREPFGGHEWEDQNGLPSRVPDPDGPHTSIGICPHCTRAGFGYPYDVAGEIWWAAGCGR